MRISWGRRYKTVVVVKVYRQHLFYLDRRRNKTWKLFTTFKHFPPEPKIYTSKTSKTSINFLDVVVRINRDKFMTDIYSKPTDFHQLLEFNWPHPIQIKKWIVYNQALLIKRLCSSSLAFEKHVESIRSWFVVIQRNLLTTNSEG